ncbi:unnamed protein product [Caenorhabditis auriculariae]|uniref:Saposin B-type domain-containing protein n=1 Tax=Caenorhabditis auriculariae TaxID=2777116 RepID=A0A8S1HXB7_9PELO|nr:unnamed protein product [Caenorhabditis auriculariae]
MRLVDLTLILAIISATHAYFYFDYPLCRTCNITVGNFGSDLESFFSISNSLMRRVCQLKESTVDTCMSTLEIVKNILDELNDELFLEASPSAKTLACSHLFTICPDKKMDGSELDSDKWSCSSCTKLLDAVFTVLSKSVNKVNDFILAVFCSSGDEDCVTDFKTAFKTTGAVGRLLSEKESTTIVAEI